ncbi:MAG: hypothetical protein ACP5G7_04280 [Anaerolineae bacterium]
MIGKAFKVVWQALRDTWGDLFMLSALNLIWFLGGFSGLFLATLVKVWYPGLLAIVTYPIATAAIYPVAYRVARGKTFHLSDYWDGVKAYWWRAILWFLANILVIILWYVNLDFYAQQIPRIWNLPQIPAVWPLILINGFWTSLFFVWLLTQMHFWPMMMVQEESNIVRAWRNSVILVLRFPVFSIIVGILSVILIVLSTVLVAPLFLFMMGLVAVLYSNATLTLLVEAGIIEGDYRPDYTR